MVHYKIVRNKKSKFVPYFDINIYKVSKRESEFVCVPQGNKITIHIHIHIIQLTPHQ